MNMPLDPCLSIGRRSNPLDTLGRRDLWFPTSLEVSHACFACLNVTTRQHMIKASKWGRGGWGRRVSRKKTYPVHSLATHPFPWQTVHEDGFAEHPFTESLAQLSLVFWSLALSHTCWRQTEGMMVDLLRRSYNYWGYLSTRTLLIWFMLRW